MVDWVGGTAGTGGVEDCARFGKTAGLGGATIHSVIGEPPADGVKSVVALEQRGEEILERYDRALGGGGKFFDPGVESGGCGDAESLVGAERGIDAGF